MINFDKMTTDEIYDFIYRMIDRIRYKQATNKDFYLDEAYRDRAVCELITRGLGTDIIGLPIININIIS